MKRCGLCAYYTQRYTSSDSLDGDCVDEHGAVIRVGDMETCGEWKPKSCTHESLNMDGCCKSCRKDCRGIQ